MPTYDYSCSRCGIFSALRAMKYRDESCSCPSCGQEALRVLVSAPALSLMSARSRFASATNERSSHSPITSDEYTARKHPYGCSCCTGKVISRANDDHKSFPDKRPWMISH